MSDEQGPDPVRALAEREGAARRTHRAATRGRALRRLGAVIGVAAVLGGPVALSPSSVSDAGTVAPELALPPIGARLAAMRVTDELEGSVEEPEPVVIPPTFAEHDGVELVLPSDGVRAVAYHEAAYDDALGLSPVGTVAANRNTTKFDPPSAREGPDYVVMSSRGRPTSATSAVDIALEPDVAVTSVVSGVVTHTEEYLLYGRHRDSRVEIEPHGRPDLRVVIIHVGGLRVEVGDEVSAGQTVLAARSTHFSFASQVDRVVDAPPGPHIHIEVKAREPGEG